MNCPDAGRDDVRGPPEYPLDKYCRNAQPIHDLVARFAMGGLESLALRTDGRAPELIAADRADGPRLEQLLYMGRRGRGSTSS